MHGQADTHFLFQCIGCTVYIPDRNKKQHLGKVLGKQIITPIGRRKPHPQTKKEGNIGGK